MNAAELVEDINKLVSLPEVCMQLDEMLASPYHNINGVAQLISQDVNLSARLLKIANSSLYGFSGRIDSITRAINLVGTSELMILVLATSTVTTFKDIPGQTFNMAGFWRHSVYTGVLAKLIARRCNILHPERLFITGLLHDIGLLVLVYSRPEIANQIFETVKQTERHIYDVEMEVLGFDHAEIGRELAKKWRLPQAFQDSIYFHHHLDELSEPMLDAAIIHVASEATGALETGEDIKADQVDTMAWQLTGLNMDDFAELHTEATPEFEDMLSILLPGINIG